LTKIADAFSEPSGIFDISSLVGYQAGSVFVTSIQGNTSSGAQLSALISPLAAPLSDSADFDSDGDVDGRDFLQWQTNVGSPALNHFAPGDANHDARVDSADLQVWQAQYGDGQVSVAAVPEPNFMLLMSVALARLVCCRLYRN
jgi:hypothetical protein